MTSPHESTCGNVDQSTLPVHMNPQFANNPQMGRKYDPSKPLNTILYMDANNLYGWATSQYLPTWGFKWVDVSTKEDWTDFIQKQGDEQDEGYFLEVDIGYPEELHDLHNTYPCAPEKFKAEEKYLSDHQKELGRGCGVKFGSKKLCLTLMDKEKYILHYRNLKQYLSLGLKMEKVHRVIKFNQFPWLKKYMDMNTQFRKEAKNKFDAQQVKR